ncbi:hypothetical protein DPX16_14763 [Anabarilius grahami]|uniref:Uncharacterized protein n=1 Tax=Anabarilius grahami TaxID=495550 RepID=A0A3N0XPG1_ANAGA|nr:hypothetical protein DPX16_14763 [Anabarilius grahami]
MADVSQRRVHELILLQDLRPAHKPSNRAEKLHHHREKNPNRTEPVPVTGPTAADSAFCLSCFSRTLRPKISSIKIKSSLQMCLSSASVPMKSEDLERILDLHWEKSSELELQERAREVKLS